MPVFFDMGFLDFLSDEPTKAGERHLAEGDVGKAVAAFFKAGDHRRAFQTAVEGKQASLATQVALHMVLGKVPAEYADATPAQAADLLFSTTHYHEALALFELAEAWKRAAETAAKLQLLPRAARLYEKARLYPLAATYYRRSEQLTDTLRMLERESSRLRTDPRARRESTALEGARKVDQERAELLRRMGRSEEAAALIRTAPPTAQGMAILESGGRIEDAIQAHIRVADFESALALLPKARLEPAARAEILIACRKPLEAATAYVQAGDLASAARAAESGGDLERAGRLWEQQQKPGRSGGGLSARPANGKRGALRGRRWKHGGGGRGVPRIRRLAARRLRIHAGGTCARRGGLLSGMRRSRRGDPSPPPDRRRHPRGRLGHSDLGAPALRGRRVRGRTPPPRDASQPDRRNHGRSRSAPLAGPLSRAARAPHGRDAALPQGAGAPAQ